MRIDFFKKLKRNRLRAIMRGYRALKKEKKIYLIRKIKDDLIKKEIEGTDGLLDIFFSGLGNNKSLILKQLLALRTETVSFSGAILYAYGKNKKLIFPLPRVLQDVIKSNNFPINTRLCSILWIGVVFLYWYRGVFTFYRYAYKQFINLFFKKKSLYGGRYTYFDGLTATNLPTNSKEKADFNIVTWYVLRKGARDKIDVICHNVSNTSSIKVNGIQVKYIDNVIPYIVKPTMMLYFILWGIGATITCAFLFIFGKWQNVLLLSEYTKAIIVRFCNAKDLAYDYLFHNSYFIYRPIWTYEAEKKGANIIFYFYSTNSELYKPGHRYIKQFNYSLMNWPKYLVWDRYQENFVTRSIRYDSSIEVVGPIWFSSGKKKVPLLPEQTVAVFDITPLRSSCFSLYAYPQEYYSAKNIGQFLIDIKDVFCNTGISIAHKKKRFSDKAHPAYVKLTNNFYSSNDMISINSDISASELIDKCKYVISFPFTSTAIIAKNQGLHSVFYDPVGIIQKNDRAAHGILVLNGIKELKKWVKITLET